MIQISLQDETALTLKRLADVSGMTIDEYLSQMTSAQVRHEPITPDELARLIEEEASEGNSLYSGTYSREDIYFDHD